MPDGAERPCPPPAVSRPPPLPSADPAQPGVGGARSRARARSGQVLLVRDAYSVEAVEVAPGVHAWRGRPSGDDRTA
ncbi:hypothetical protein BG452_15005 [Streptomyces sp. CBMA123]|nr:hypothetical protein [Streptomyces sp. CBMA123]